MRRVTILLCLSALSWTGVVAADQAPTIDGSSVSGIRLIAETDELDPAIVHCSVVWLQPADTGRVSVRGPAGLIVVPSEGPADTISGTWQHEWPSVSSGQGLELLVDLRTLAEGEQALVVVERVLGEMSYQAIARFELAGAGIVVSETASFRSIHSSAGPRRGAVVVESLGPETLPAEAFGEDSTDYPIPDGPANCSPSNPLWALTTVINISSAPPSAVATAVTVHVTITHPDMSDLEVGFFKEFATIGGYLWNNGAGVNLDRDFNRDAFNQPLPGIGGAVNGSWILVIRDCFAADTGTLAYWSVRVEYGSPSAIDLVADALSVDPTTVEPGDSVEVDWSGHVAGTGTVGASFAVGFYLSTDTNITTGDQLLDQVTVSSANDPGDSFGASSPGRSMIIPGSVADGAYYLGMIVDSTDAIAETNESNNVAWSTLTVESDPGSVDLVADSIASSVGSVAAGSSFNISYAGHLTGPGTVSSSFSLGFYLSTDSNITTGDFLLGQRFGAWATNDGDTFDSASYGLSVPPSTPAGTYYLGFFVDDTGVITESNETNNVATYYPLEVSSGAGNQPNLEAMPCSVSPITADPGGSVVLSWRALNSGDGASGPFIRGIYLSDDALIDPDTDVVIAETSVGGWPAGHDTGTQQNGVVLPGGLEAGLYHVGLVLDIDGTVSESDETDNSCQAGVLVGSASPTPLVTRWLVPAAASAPGVGTSDWRTQITVVNPTSQPRTASFYYVVSGSAWPGVLLRGPESVPAHRAAYFDDVLGTLNPTSGLIYVVLDDVGPVVSSRTYNLVAGGATFGQGIPALPLDGVSAPTDLVIPMVHSVPGRYRTNLGLVQTAPGTLQVEVAAYSSTGSLLAIKIYSQQAAWRQVNDLFGDLGLGGMSVEGGWLYIRWVGGSGSYWSCYASVVDNLTDDPTFVAPMEFVVP